MFFVTNVVESERAISCSLHLVVMFCAAERQCSAHHSSTSTNVLVDADIAQVIAGRYYIGIVLNMVIRYTETEHMEGESCNSLVTS